MTVSNEVVVAVENEKPVTKAMAELYEKISLVQENLTSEDKVSVINMVAAEAPPTLVDVSPEMAAELFMVNNTKNRGVSVGRIQGYAGDMVRGEWMENHQGIAFYEDGHVADGQHRLAAIALSGVPQRLLVSNGFSVAAIDSIDRSTRRNAGESLEMNGVANGKVKARLMRIGLVYEATLVGSSSRFSDIQLETAVHAHNTLLDEAIDIGEKSVSNVTEPCLNKGDAQAISFIMLLGGWSRPLVSGYISSVQQGVAAYPESPTVYLSRIYTKAKFADRRKDKLTPTAKYALAIKGAALWASETSVAKVAWNANKEDLPSNEAPHKEAA